ncbi:hypothetical protein ACM39_01355 [Chryseobacterium sp. FH2]|nr:hypothetical protein ACM39_01355 [Chryseobacterium sp. FH2]
MLHSIKDEICFKKLKLYFITTNIVIFFYISFKHFKEENLFLKYSSPSNEKYKSFLPFYSSFVSIIEF